MGKNEPFSIGSDVWPGLSKLIEECGEVLQVGGKLMGTGGAVQHWDGTNLRERLQDELGDAIAAIDFIVAHNDLDAGVIALRAEHKRGLFERWHTAEPPLPAQEPSPNLTTYHRGVIDGQRAHPPAELTQEYLQGYKKGRDER